MTNEQNCGTYSIKDVKPALPEEKYFLNCNLCPYQNNAPLCNKMMKHPERHCEKYVIQIKPTT